MNKRPGLILAILALNCASVFTARAQTTAFTYQGRLTDMGAPASGSYDLQFLLYDALTDGTQIGLDGVFLG
jgi:hypothetical protein